MLRLLDRLGVGCCLYTPARGVFAFDTGFAEILDRSPDQILGISMRDVTHPEDAAANAWLLEGALKTGGSFALRKRYRLPNGQVRWVQNRYTVFKPEEGETVISLQSRPVPAPASPPPEHLAGVPEYAQQMILELGRMCAEAGMTATAELLAMAHHVAQEEHAERTFAP